MHHYSVTLPYVVRLSQLLALAIMIVRRVRVISTIFGRLQYDSVKLQNILSITFYQGPNSMSINDFQLKSIKLY